MARIDVKGVEYLVLRNTRNQISEAVTALKGAKLHLYRVPVGLFASDIASEVVAIDRVIATLESLKIETTDYLKRKAAQKG